MKEIVKYTKDQFIEKFNPREMMVSTVGIKKMEQAIEADKKSISVYAKEIGTETVLVVLEMHLTSLCDTLNVHEKLSPFQVQEIAIELNAMYFHLSIVEIAYVFRKAKRGQYGEIKYSIDMPQIMIWFEKYAEERCQYFMTKSTTSGEKNQQNAEQSKIFTNEQVKQLAEIREKMVNNGNTEEDYQEYKKKYNAETRTDTKIQK